MKSRIDLNCSGVEYLFYLKGYNDRLDEDIEENKKVLLERCK